MRTLGVTAAAVAAVCGCKPLPVGPPSGTMVASAGANPVLGGGPVARPPLAAPGELMLYRVSLHGFELAEYSITVGDATTLEGSDVVVVQSAARTTKVVAWFKPIEDIFTSWISRNDGRSVRFLSSERASKDDDRKETTEARTAAGQVTLQVTRGDERYDETQVIAGHGGHDLNSFLILLRGWEGEPGAHLDADVVRSRFVWRVRVKVIGYDNLSTALGNLPVARYDGEGVRLVRDGTIDPASDVRRFSIWLTDDADRVPVKLLAKTDYGDVTMELLSYRPGEATAQ
ncbi:MAG: DUF3108 domain-containing protein [Kofleriaceae bacterium]|nr:MAG: DUF3108 domain-containing protein [Kofleriaceae bacterium]